MMSNNEPMGVRTCDIVQVDLIVLHDTDGTSWRDIARLDAYSGIPPGTLCAIYHGVPIPKKWYEQLGIPPEVTITPINGHHIPEGTQVFMARQCINDDCEISFAPNSPKRKKCYDCQKVRVRK